VQEKRRVEDGVLKSTWTQRELQERQERVEEEKPGISASNGEGMRIEKKKEDRAATTLMNHE
jgi:hypothetical protein